MAPYQYGWEKLHSAVHSLTGSQDQKQRLVEAVFGNLVQVNPENDLPQVMHEEFTSFVEGMASTKSGNDRATIMTLDEHGIRKAIEKILGFYDAVCRHMKPV